MNKVLIISILTIGFTYQSSAQKKDPMPSLGDHTFVPTDFVNSPFINTMFSTSLGTGFSIQQDFPSFDLGNGEIIGLNGTIVFLGLGFQYKARLKDWIAFEARANVSGRVGSDLLSLISQGFSSVSLMDLGWLIKVYESDKFIISATVGVNSASGNFINLADFVEDVIAGDTTAQLSRKVNVTTGGIGYRLAWSPTKLFGLSSTGSLYYGETFQGSSLYYLTRFTATADLNLKSAYDFPLGFAYGVDINSLPEFVYVNDRSAILQNLRIAYMGSGDFSLGLEANFGLLPVAGFEKKVKAATFSITSQYFFK